MILILTSLGEMTMATTTRTTTVTTVTTTTINFGMIVVVKTVDGRRVMNNVTEVHYRYEGGQKTAFESDIHSTGCTLYNSEILEMEITPATKQMGDFDGE